LEQRGLVNEARLCRDAGGRDGSFHEKLAEGVGMVKAVQVKRQRGRIPISELLDYWIDILKRPTLTVEDFALFFEKAQASFEYFADH
jgi:hypothetical protein